MGKTNPGKITIRRIENDLRQLFDQTLPERIRRYQEFKPHPIVANHHFSAASAECIDLYRDGNFYGCIALVQAVSEALVRFLCERNGWGPEKTFEKNVDKLCKRNFISHQIKAWLLEIWEKRDDYHHLNPKIENDLQKLEILAKEKVMILILIPKEFVRLCSDDLKVLS